MFAKSEAYCNAVIVCDDIWTLWLLQVLGYQESVNNTHYFKQMALHAKYSLILHEQAYNNEYWKSNLRFASNFKGSNFKEF